MLICPSQHQLGGAYGVLQKDNDASAAVAAAYDDDDDALLLSCIRMCR